MKTLFRPLLLATFALGATATTHAALVAGDIALIGWNANGTPTDSFIFVTLSPISAGEDIYFTDNGWTGAQFRGAGNISPIDGDGNEGLMKWTATANIPAGRIINSTGTGADFLWTRNNVGEIPGAQTGQFTDLGLANFGTPPNGEQIYAFQATINNPLFNPTSHLFVLDNSNLFEPATDSHTGAATPGLTVGNTALTFNFSSFDYIAFNTNSLASGTKAQWLTVISNSNNWLVSSTGTLPSGTINVVPEPTAALAFATGLGVLLSQRRRRKA
jgi:hypothetical protein